MFERGEQKPSVHCLDTRDPGAVQVREHWSPAIQRNLFGFGAVEIRRGCSVIQQNYVSKSQLDVMKIFGAFLWFLTSSALCGTFAVDCDGKMERASRGCTIKLTGKIERGDAARLRQVIGKPLNGGWYYGKLLLDSPGGDVQEALLLAGVVRDAMLATSTSSSSPEQSKFVDEKGRIIRLGDRDQFPCASSCFLVWVAGTERFSGTGRDPKYGPYGIGLHRPYFPPEAYANSPSQVAEAQQSMTVAVRDYLRREQVPELFIEKMMDRSSREVYWVDESGDRFAMTGTAGWFEEMMIARCGFDPVYDQKSQEAEVRYQEAGAATLTIVPGYPPGHDAWIAWRQKYNACEYSIRRVAQAAMRR